MSIWSVVGPAAVSGAKWYYNKKKEEMEHQMKYGDQLSLDASDIRRQLNLEYAEGLEHDPTYQEVLGYPEVISIINQDPRFEEALIRTPRFRERLARDSKFRDAVLSNIGFRRSMINAAYNNYGSRLQSEIQNEARRREQELTLQSNLMATEHATNMSIIRNMRPRF